MTVDQVLKLIDAGYTAAEIKAMEDPKKAEPEKKEPEKKEPEKKEPEKKEPEKKEPEKKAEPEKKEPEKKAEPAPDPLDAIKAQIQGLTDAVEKMSKSIIMPTLDDVNPLGIEDIITNFFKEE